MEFLPFFIVGLFGVILFAGYYFLRKLFPGKAGRKMVCLQCGYSGRGKRLVKGSLGVEILLWLCFLVPGIMYSVWRTSGNEYGCPKCGSTNLIPADSPRGQKLLKEYSSNQRGGQTT